MLMMLAGPMVAMQFPTGDLPCWVLSITSGFEGASVDDLQDAKGHYPFLHPTINAFFTKREYLLPAV